MTKKKDYSKDSIPSIIVNTLNKLFGLGKKHSNTHYEQSFDSIKISKKRNAELEKIYQKASKLVKNNINNIPGLIEFIENRGTMVIQKKHADKLLRLLGKYEGFIPPMKGLSAKGFLLGLKVLGAWQGPIEDESPAMFVFRDKIPNIAFLVYHMHHWITFNKGLPGYSEKTQKTFAQIFDPSFGFKEISKMSREEIVELREAIARDQEALDFLQRISEELLAPQSILQGIKEGNRKNI